MSATATLQRQIECLIEVSEQLESLANEHPFMGEALLVIAGSLRNNTTLPEILATTKISS